MSFMNEPNLYAPIWNIYRHPKQGLDLVHDTDERNGSFSWPAFFFSALWMLKNRLWKIAAIWLTTLILLVVLGRIADHFIEGWWTQVFFSIAIAVGYIALWLVAGCKGHGWREADLIRRGYKKVLAVKAETKKDAIDQIPALLLMSDEQIADLGYIYRGDRYIHRDEWR